MLSVFVSGSCKAIWDLIKDEIKAVPDKEGAGNEQQATQVEATHAVNSDSGYASSSSITVVLV